MDWCPGCGLEQKQPGRVPFRFVVGLLVLAALLGGVGGYYGAPRRVEVVERVKTQTQVQLVEVEKRVEVQVAAEAKTQTRIVYRTRTVHPDGTQHATELEADTVEQVRQQVAVKQQGTKREAHQVQVVDVARAQVTERGAPGWRAALLVGAPLKLEVPTARTLAVGIHAERRVFGPVFVGAWALKPLSGAPTFVGLSAGAEF